MGATYTRQSTYAEGDVIQASDTNDEFDQLLAAFAASTGHTHDGTTGEGGPITTLAGHSITIGLGTAGTDITLTFDGETSDGVLKWMEDEDYFEFSDDILVASTEKLQFRDTALYINSSTDGQLDIVADTLVQVASAAFTVDASGDITLDAGGADVVLKDDGTTFGSLTNSSGELVIKSGSTPTAALTFSGANITAEGNLTVDGNLDVTGTFDLSDSNFTNAGNIQLDSISGDADTNTSITFSGSDVITVATGGSTAATFNADQTTTFSGAVSGTSADFDGGVTVDNITIDGTEIDLSSGDLTVDVAGDIILDADGGDVLLKDAGTQYAALTNTSGDLIIKSGSTTAMTFSGANVTFAGTVTIGSAGISEAELEILDGATVTTDELNIMDGDTSATSTTLADADRVVVNDAGTMKQVALTDFETYFESALDTLSNVTTVGALNSGSITSGFGSIDNGSSAITTTGTITGGVLTADDVSIDGKVITLTGSTDDTATITVGTNGTLDITTTDNAAAAANIQITADGTAELAGTTVTLDSAGDIELNADGGDVVLKDDSATYGSLTNSSGNLIIKSGTTTAMTFSGANATVAGDLTISGDDLTMATNTSGHLLIADGTNFNPTAVGDLAEISSVANDDVFLAVDTSGGGLKKITRSTIVSGLAVSGSGIANVVEDTTPQLGGSLDVNGEDIVSVSNGNITITPNGSGVLRIDGSNGIDMESGAISIKNSGAESYVRFYCESSNAHYTQLQAAPHSAYSGNVTVVLPASADTLVGKATTDTLTNKTFGDNVSFGDNNITNVGDIALDSISADATDINVAVTDNSATAFTIKQGSDAYFVVDTANSSESVSIGTGVSGTAITLGHSTSEVTVSDNLTVTGNLTVSGTTTTVNSTTVNLNDHNIVLDSNNSTSAVVNGAGITIEGGSGDDATFTYNTTGPKFELKLGSNHEDLQVDQLIAASLDISGNVDVDGTLEADAITVNGTALAEFISDTTGAMFSSNTETGITVTYQDGDNTIDLAVDAAQTGITSVKNTSLVIGRDDDNLIKFGTDNQIIFEVSGGDNVIFKASGEIEASSLDISGDVDIDGTLETDALSINGTAVTSTAAELNILDGVTASAADINLIDGITNGTVIASKAIITDSNKDISGGRNITITGELAADSLDIEGNVDINGTLEADAITVNGTALNTVIAGVTVTDATNAAHVLVTDNESTNENNLITFVENATSSTGNVGLEMDGNLTYNPSTGRLTATQLAGTLQTAAQANITSLGTLTALTVDDITINGSTISDAADLTIDVGGDIILDADGADVTLKDAGTQYAAFTNSSGNLLIYSGTTFAQSFSGANAAFQGTVTANSGVIVDNITIDGTEIDLSSGDLTVDVAGDIILDADGGDVFFKDGGTSIGLLKNNNSDFEMRSLVNDKDLKFSGEDGGSTIVALTLDMSAAGAATFNSTIADADGNVRAIPQSGSAKTSGYTLATGDVGNFIEVGSSGAITIPNSTFSAGDAVSIFNNTSGDVTVTCSITTAYIAGTDEDKSSVTLATRGVCTVLFISGTVCVLSGNVS